MAGQKLDSIIEKAIGKEQEAYEFYMDLHSRIEDAATRDTLLYVAGEEREHKEFLIGYRDGRLNLTALPLTERVDYRLAEYLSRPDPKEIRASEDVFLVAAHRELASAEFYREMAAIQPAGEVREVLLRMANEERGHKEKMEYLYSNTAFPQTSGG